MKAVLVHLGFLLAFVGCEDPGAGGGPDNALATLEERGAIDLEHPPAGPSSAGSGWVRPGGPQGGVPQGELGLGLGRDAEPRAVGPAVPPPDPSLLVTLMPEAATAGPPTWVRAGTRLVFYAASASVRHAASGLQLDPEGKWIHRGTGQRFSQYDVPTASGHGYTVVDVGHVDPHHAALHVRALMMDVTANHAISFAGSGGSVTHAGAGLDFWVHPQVLARLEPVQAEGTSIIRMPYSVEGRRYDAVRIQTTSNQGYSAYTYDLDSGVLLHAGTATAGAPMLAPPAHAGGAPQPAQGNTQLTTTVFVERRHLALPWSSAPRFNPPFQALHYEGQQVTHMAHMPEATLRRAMTTRVIPGPRSPDWLRFESHTSIQSPPGLPAEESMTSGVSAGAATGNLFLSPAALARLRPGQVIDRDARLELLLEVSYVGPLADGRSGVVITERGATFRFDWAFDLESGRLHALTIQQQVGMATTTHEIRLVRIE